MNILDFEKPIIELELKIEELRNFGEDKNITLDPEIKKLEEKLEKMKTEIYERLTIWQRVQIARHPDRPYTLDYIRMLTTDFIELHGDRQFADDLALIAGIAQIDKTKVLIIGHQKGRDTNENVLRNFGCAHPEGYRKAIRHLHYTSAHIRPSLGRRWIQDQSFHECHNRKGQNQASGFLKHFGDFLAE